MKFNPVATLQNASKTIWPLLGGALFLGWSILVVSCATTTTDRQVVPPPGSAPGATYVGSEQCAACHDKVSSGFATATHARLVAQGENGVNAGCEACHGPGSAHVQAGGGKVAIINPKNSPEVCFQCHLDKRGQFRLAHSHPVLSGHMSCTDCHDPHKGSAVTTGGTQLAGINATCAKCHLEQGRPKAFEHQALREGCTFCHDPHGTVNAKMLKVRNAILCIQCHAQGQTLTGGVMIGNHVHSQSQLSAGACWSAGCHTNVHGSNTSSHFRPM
jgi:predicted CXXCH cytochrome family protein